MGFNQPRPRILFLWILVLVCILATIGKHMLNTFVAMMRKPSDDPPYTSPEEAKHEGTWISDVEIRPSRFMVAGQIVEINQVWIEEASVPDHYLVWIPYRKPLGRTYLCITLARGDELFDQDITLRFVMPGAGRGLSHIRRGHFPPIYIIELDSPDAALQPITLERMKDGASVVEPVVLEAKRITTRHD